MFLRRLGPNRNQHCTEAVHCPDLFEMTDGSFGIIGTDITAEAQPVLPPSASCGPHEKIIRRPRALLIAARDDIPSV